MTFGFLTVKKSLNFSPHSRAELLCFLGFVLLGRTLKHLDPVCSLLIYVIEVESAFKDQESGRAQLTALVMVWRHLTSQRTSTRCSKPRCCDHHDLRTLLGYP